MKRPNEFMDAIALEEWAERVVPHLLCAWEYSDCSEYMDFWEWLDLNHPDAMRDFRDWFEEMGDV